MMDDYSEIISKAKRAVKYWWLKIISGAVMIALGVVTLAFPVEGYVGLCIFFGIAMFISGLVQIIIALASRNFIVLRGYSIIGAIVDIILGSILCFHPEITIVMFPLILGFWLLYHSFVLIGFGGDMNMLKMKEAPLFIILGVCVLILSFIILINPFSFGVAIVIIIASIAFILQGVAMIIVALKLKQFEEDHIIK